MDARTALKNYTTIMIKTYGAEYWEHWTEDDKETFNILARRVRPEITENRKEDRSVFMRRFLGIRVGGVERATERKEAWKEAASAAASGSRITGILAPEGTSTNRWYDRKTGQTNSKKNQEVKAETVINRSGIAPDDVDSQNIARYLMGL